MRDEKVVLISYEAALVINIMIGSLNKSASFTNKNFNSFIGIRFDIIVVFMLFPGVNICIIFLYLA